MAGTSTLAVGGLASGMDTNAIIDNLVSLEQQKVTRIQKRQATAETTLSTYGKLKAQLGSFKDKAAAMSTIDSFSLFKSTSSDPSSVDIEGTGKGVQGNFTIGVNQLASSLKVSSKSFEDSTASLGLKGTLRLSTSATYQESNPSSTFVDIAVNPNDALTDIASRINSATGVGATASVLNISSGDTRLVLTGQDTGSAGFKVSDPNATALSDLAKTLGFVEGSNSTESASDFSFRLVSGGPAKLSTKLSEVFTGVGKSLAVGDTLTYLDKAYSVNANNTVEDVLKQMSLDLKTSGANFSLDNSGRIVIKDGLVDVKTLAIGVTHADGSRQILGGMDAQTRYSNVVQQGQDAFYTLNGLSMQSSDNTDMDSMEGATIQLKKVTGANPVQIAVARDDAGIKDMVQGVQVAAPFGRYASAVDVLEALGSPRSATV